MGGHHPSSPFPMLEARPPCPSGATKHPTMGHGPFHLVLRLKESTVRFWFDFCIAVSAKKSWRRKESIGMLGLPHGVKGKAAGLSLPQLCSVSSTREEARASCLSKS